jgi:hypothetical protein
MQRDGMEERIEELLGGLQKVGAPVGFEERVMRRITGSGSGERSRGPALLLSLKFAVPAAVLLLMGAMFVFFGGREPDVASVPPVLEDQIVTSHSEELPQTTETALLGSASSDQMRRSPKVSASRLSNGSVGPRSRVNSEDIALQGPGETFTPPGLDARVRNVDPSTVPPGGGGNIRDVLSFIGVSADCGHDGCRVTSLSNGSLADQAKLNVGDRIVLIDGRPINDSTSFSGPTSFKSFQVVRGGRSINLSLRSN